MGKVRIKTLGVEELEKEQKEKVKVKKEQKQARKTAKAPGMKGGERVVAVGPTEEELATTEDTEKLSDKTVVASKSSKARAPRERSRHYREALTLVDRNRVYPLPEALELLKSPSLRSKFDGTVELHINTIEKGVSGQVTLPHGTGKNVRVAIADDAVIADVENGKIDFDVLLAHSSVMPKLAKVARILGPKGLMPNPKSGTISDTPEKLAEKYKAGQMHFRTEAAAPIIHLVVGKVSMKEKDLAENIQTVIGAIGPQKIRNVTLKSTMSPGIKIAL